MFIKILSLLRAISNDVGNHGFPQFFISSFLKQCHLLVFNSSFLQSIHLSLPSRVTIVFLCSSPLQSFLSGPDSPNHLFSSNVPETSSALFLFLRLVSCLFQLFAKPLHFLLCLSKEPSSFISKTTFHSFPNALSYQMLLTKFCFHVIAPGTHSSSVLTF